jgi:hypothetical protein
LLKLLIFGKFNFIRDKFCFFHILYFFFSFISFRARSTYPENNALSALLNAIFAVVGGACIVQCILPRKKTVQLSPVLREPQTPALSGRSFYRILNRYYLVFFCFSGFPIV